MQAVRDAGATAIGAPGLLPIKLPALAPRGHNVTVGWGTWFDNRRVGLRNRWSRLRMTNSYRGTPQLQPAYSCQLAHPKDNSKKPRLSVRSSG
jgi:hypothetical protein